jgi:hypothetical protein
MNQAHTEFEQGFCASKNGDRLLFLEEKGLFLPVDSCCRKSSLSPFCVPFLMMNQTPAELTIGDVNAMKRNYYEKKRRALCQPIFTSSLLISSS